MSILDNPDYFEELEGLNKEEKEVALRILKEYSEKGSSKEFNNILYEDYNEIPVDIETFVTDDNYLGKAWKDASGKLKLYPFWLKKLKQLFPNNLDTSVNNFIESGARGLGKSEMAVLCGLYLMYRILCLKNPLEHFRLKPTETICFAFMNITKILAEDIGISKFQETVQLSPWFMQRGQMTRLNNMPYWVPPKPIEIIIGSQASHVIGRAIYFCFFDEISFIKNMDIDKQKQIAINMVDTALGGMKTRYIYQGKNPTLMILESSKRSEKSFLEEHMKQKLKSEKENVLIVDEAVWNVKPEGTYKKEKFPVALGNKFMQSTVLSREDNIDEWIEKGYKIIYPPIDFLPNFMDDIDRALCDYAGISSSEISKYISGSAVKDIIDESKQNLFVKDIIEVGNAPEDTAQYYDFIDVSRITSEIKEKPMFIHLDMSVSGDKTGIAGVVIKSKRTSTDQDNMAKDLYFDLVFSVSIKAPKGRQISFEKNRQFIYWLKEQGFAIKGITSDTFQSYDTGQALLARGYNYEVLSVDRVDSDHICKPYQYLKSTIYEKRFCIYNSRLLIQEITELERNINTGRVDHPENGSKDMSDAVCGAMFNASKHAEEFAFNYGEDLENIVEVSLTNINPDRKQLEVDLEEQLRSVFNRKNTDDSDKNFTDFGWVGLSPTGRPPGATAEVVGTMAAQIQMKGSLVSPLPCTPIQASGLCPAWQSQTPSSANGALGTGGNCQTPSGLGF